ncbi:MAG: hypothetical protein IKR76_06445 [Ruminococcus sp.]|nr:hypothetical protein [Ruminococcus sp.]
MQPRKYTIVLINGDYVQLIDIETGEPMLIAAALLPQEIEEGGIVLYENLVYTYLG